MIRVTKHAKERAKERCGVKAKSMERIAEKVLQNGMKHGECSGQLKRWVDKLYLNGKAANNIRLYGENAYLFKDTTLITIIPIPKRLAGHAKMSTHKKREESKEKGQTASE